MKKTCLSLLIAAITMSVFFTSCKKDNDSTEVFSSITDTAGNDVMTLTFDNENRPIKAVASTTTFDFFYSGGKLIKRTTTLSGSLDAVDSFFYDGNNRFSKVISYNSGGVKRRETVLTYNADNSLNQSTINTSVWGESDMLYEFTYNGSNLNKVVESEKMAGTFNKKREYEFLAYDAKTNPISSLIEDYFPDQYNLLIFLWMGNNNFTSAKQTDYSLINGEVTGTFPITATYTYNGSGLPTEIVSTINGNTNRSYYHYKNL